VTVGLMLGLILLVVADLTRSVLPVFVGVVAVAFLVQLLTVEALAVTLAKGGDLMRVGATQSYLPALRARQRSRLATTSWCGATGLIVSTAAALFCLGISAFAVCRDATAPASGAGLLTLIFGVAAWGYARGSSSARTPLTWLCPNPACATRHISERHAWRCAFCKQVNQNTSMLDGCRVGDCRERPSGYLCPACGHTMLFEETADATMIAISPEWTPPPLERPGQRERIQRSDQVQSKLDDLKDEHAIRQQEIEVRRWEAALTKLAAELDSGDDVDSIVRDAASRIRRVMKVKSDLERIRTQQALLIDEEHVDDKRRAGQRKAELDDVVDDCEAMLLKKINKE